MSAVPMLRHLAFPFVSPPPSCIFFSFTATTHPYVAFRESPRLGLKICKSVWAQYYHLLTDASTDMPQLPTSQGYCEGKIKEYIFNCFQKQMGYINKLCQDIYTEGEMGYSVEHESHPLTNKHIYFLFCVIQ